MTKDAIPDFLDDYFAECDEHLAVVRRLLLALEALSASPRSTVPLSTNCFGTSTR